MPAIAESKVSDTNSRSSNNRDTFTFLLPGLNLISPVKRTSLWKSQIESQGPLPGETLGDPPCLRLRDTMRRDRNFLCVVLLRWHLFNQGDRDASEGRSFELDIVEGDVECMYAGVSWLLETEKIKIDLWEIIYSRQTWRNVLVQGNTFVHSIARLRVWSPSSSSSSSLKPVSLSKI